MQEIFVYIEAEIRNSQDMFVMLHIVSWEPKGHYHYSNVFHWEPEGC